MGKRHPLTQTGKAIPQVRLTLRSGEKVEDCRHDRNSVPKQLLAELLLSFQGGPQQIKDSADFSHLLPDERDYGIVNVISCPDDSHIIMAKRPGKAFATPFVRVQTGAEERTSIVTVVLERQEECYKLLSLYWGEQVPPEPADHNGIEREVVRLLEKARLENRSVSQEIIRADLKREIEVFWRTHARRLGAHSVYCSHCHWKIVPKRQVLAGYAGEDILLCRECDLR